MAKRHPLKEATQRLEEAKDNLDELLRLQAEDEEVQAVLEVPKWAKWFGKKVEALSVEPLPDPPTEDEKPMAPVETTPDEPSEEPSEEQGPAPDEAPEDTTAQEVEGAAVESAEEGISTAGEEGTAEKSPEVRTSAEHAEEPTDEPAPKEPEPEEPDEEVIEQEAQKTASPANIFELASRTQQQSKEFLQAMGTARQALQTILGEQQIEIAGDAIFSDLDTEYEKRAFEWLVIQITREEMTAEEAIAYARDQEDWVIELTYRRDWIRQIQGIVIQAGEQVDKDFELVFWVSPANGGPKVDLRILITEAIQDGELTIEKAAEMALNTHGWTREKKEEQQPSSRRGRGYSRSGPSGNEPKARQQHRDPPPGTQGRNSNDIVVSG